MRLGWRLAVANQLVSGAVMLFVRELKDRRPGPPPVPPRDSTGSRARLAGILVAMLVFNACGSAWLGSMLWWLAPGRGPGGRLIAASSVNPRPYRFGR